MESSGGMDGEVLPASGEPTRLTLGADDVASTTKGGVLLGARRFRAREGASIYGPAWLLEYEGEPGEPSALWLADARTLVIGDNQYDGYSSTYTRVAP